MAAVTEWRTLGLSSWLAESCIEFGLRQPTPIQASCIAPALAGRDVLGSAETGSGKTAAFVLPIVQALSEDRYGVFAVVLSPARELASQIADQFLALGARMPVRVAVVVGGVDMMRQALELAERPHIVVGTPGRLADHLRSSGAAAIMRKARFLVIDEADRLLELGFADDVGAILAQLPGRKQTLLFSATMSGALQRLQRLALTAPHVADLAPSEHLPAGLSQQFVFVPANVRDLYLVHLLRAEEEGGTAIVFTSSCRCCETLAHTLRALGIDCAPLHSQQPQVRRLAALGRFKQGSLRLLICTDVAARGIDIPAVGLVLNHNVPSLPKDYVHRCGRTARAGRSGRAITIVSQYDIELLQAIEAAVGRQLDGLEPPEDEVLSMLNEVASARQAATLELTDNGFLERDKERKQKRKDEKDEREGRGASRERPEHGGAYEEGDEAHEEGEWADEADEGESAGEAGEGEPAAPREAPRRKRKAVRPEGSAPRASGGKKGTERSQPKARDREQRAAAPHPQAHEASSSGSALPPKKKKKKKKRLSTPRGGSYG